MCEHARSRKDKSQAMCIYVSCFYKSDVRAMFSAHIAYARRSLRSSLSCERNTTTICHTAQPTLISISSTNINLNKNKKKHFIVVNVFVVFFSD